jgi:acylpyruvate hydrolase
MRFATIRTSAGTTAARLDGDTLVPLDAPDVGALLAAGGLMSAPATVGAAPVPAADANFDQIVANPSKIICVGLNYRTHIQETGRDLPQYPTLFAKFAETLMGPNDDLAIPAVSERVDWEAELGVIIGKPVYRAGTAEAAAAIAGYTVTNDVSMRDFQRRTLQWDAGKIFQHTTPAGPYLVTPDEVDDAADLEIGCSVDGETKQLARTSDLLFKPADVVAYASQAITLRPGDLLLTGTTGGVGDARQPPEYLKPGQVVRTWIEGVGECVNHCVAEKAALRRRDDGGGVPRRDRHRRHVRAAAARRWRGRCPRRRSAAAWCRCQAPGTSRAWRSTGWRHGRSTATCRRPGR